MKHHTGRPSHLKVMLRGMGGGLPGNSMTSNTSKYRKGGRACHAEGEGVSPVTGDKIPNIDTTMSRARGGRACHAEGDKVVGTPMRKGGKKRHRRADGGMEAMHESPMERMGMNGRGTRSMQDSPFYAEGGKTEALRKGGKKRRRHAEGGEEMEMSRLEKMRRGGRKKKA
jgi:hypothetical protein